ncbi:hypothetical protein N781_04450 [Pontibacillus halophilus JSM 076056 = DSM 19796]|uniref:Methyltransferase domain-containing protein n=1 Tax=Pontibacillus halophilus JSM 076056 = DSM 19796 TaxID=1385510 RepID=A0A0A5GDW6_9BACI|nr:class I SAM-dependent methyltransferase [Pontibacillus halophilus]KGX91401.1 hypothetical protein N781_04450 [Pontibacillus halophilus JSM 076056 = DSM 19796]
MSNGNLYPNTASFYDLDNPLSQEELAYYVNRIGEERQVLELGCGTGRLTIPLAERGHDVTAIDLSPQMISILRSKLRDEAITPIQANMTSFTLNKAYDVILVSGFTFHALITYEEQIACLQQIHAHLTPNGLVLIVLFQPTESVKTEQLGVPTRLWEVVDLHTGRTVQKYNLGKQVDLHKQLLTPSYAYDVLDGENRLSRHEEHLTLRYFEFNEVQSLLDQAGLHIVRTDYSFSDSRDHEHNYWIINARRIERV